MEERSGGGRNGDSRWGSAPPLRNQDSKDACPVGGAGHRSQIARILESIESQQKCRFRDLC